VLLIGGRHRSIRSALLSGSSTLPPKGRIQMSETNYLQITHIQLATHGRRANQQYRNAVVLMT
jgi:hypothetical protein